MNAVNVILAALALAIALPCSAGGRAQVVIRNPHVIWSLGDEDPRALTVRKDGQERVSILDTGDISFAPGATINTGIVMPRAGVCVGYMVVRINGEPMLVPVYTFVPGDTPPPEFERDTGPIRQGWHARDCRR
jgi:hypothetical protein